ncbi:MAG: 50S ribosomal protein L15 [Kiloniellales bacterium]|nr:50S ribosomal protein L15 [Kiloniellales bacterium]
MKLNELAPAPGSRKPRKRVGRGIGSGLGKTSGKGHKGQKSRSGVAVRAFEGGQMPIYRRLPKRGFKNPFRKVYEVVNLDRLQEAIDAGKIDPAAKVDGAALRAAGLVNQDQDGVRLLARGELKVALTIEVDGASRAARAAVEKAGGSVVVPGDGAAEPAPEPAASSEASSGEQA